MTWFIGRRLLQAIPRTPLYERLEKVGRLRAPAAGPATAQVQEPEVQVEPPEQTIPQLPQFPLSV